MSLDHDSDTLNQPPERNDAPIRFNDPHLYWQPLIAVVFLGLALWGFRYSDHANLIWAVGAGALASSSYCVFSMPTSRVSRPLNILGGYIVATLIGMLVRVLTNYFDVVASIYLTEGPIFWMVLSAACGVGLFLLIMAMLRISHPPAAGLTMVLVLDVRDSSVLIVVMISAILLTLLRLILKPWLRDLIPP